MWISGFTTRRCRVALHPSPQPTCVNFIRQNRNSRHLVKLSNRVHWLVIFSVFSFLISWGTQKAIDTVIEINVICTFLLVYQSTRRTINSRKNKIITTGHSACDLAQSLLFRNFWSSSAFQKNLQQPLNRHEYWISSILSPQEVQFCSGKLN